MSFLSILYSVLLMPIQLVFEVVFKTFYTISDMKAGVAIIALSLTINLLVLPLYRRADAMQEEERRIEAKLRDGVQHIKKTFHGNERTMMLQTYYRQNRYSPLYTLRGAVSLLLEIPFFIAAYRFLSGLAQLQSVRFGPIADLGQPDAMLSFGSFSVNVLPILMTAINVVSTIIFTKGQPLKAKIQLYGMAALFLVLLYSSPAGLVFYWTLNNLFSLVKTIFYQLKDPKKAIRILLLCFGLFMIWYAIAEYRDTENAYALYLYLGIAILSALPFALHPLWKRISGRLPRVKSEPSTKLFLISGALLTVLTGLLIPSAVISASPQEFIIVGNFVHPVWYIVSATLIAAGFFILWMGVFYWLFSPKAKVILERVMLILGVSGIVNYLFFGTSFGTLSPNLTYDRAIYYPFSQVLLNIALTLLIAAIMIFALRLKVRITAAALSVVVLAMACMSGINVVGIYGSVAEIDVNAVSSRTEKPTFTLSRNGQNVIVLMLDRALGEYMPYIMSEYPALEKQYEGFTYYSNTISYGTHTNIAAPALFGGYEYTPVEINRRDEESLESKHNEALKVMPAIFEQAGYNVTVCDPPYAGYKEIPDLSIYDDYPDIKTYITNGSMSEESTSDQVIEKRNRDFFFHSVFKIAPAFLQSMLYFNGTYCSMDSNFISLNNSYDVLKQMSNLTKITDDEVGSFLMMENETTHNICFFEDEDFLVPTYDFYHNQNHGNLTLDGRTLKLETYEQVGSYQCSVAALMRLGEWFDDLRAKGVYDNTRIILVSDHGYAYGQIEELLSDGFAPQEELLARHNDPEFFFPLLMVKDFGSGDPLVYSDEFMTNADVPTLATQDLIDDPTNPFTGKEINMDEKTAHDQYIIASDIFSIKKNNGYTFLPSDWYSVHDSIWKKENWKLVAEDSVLPYSK